MRAAGTLICVRCGPSPAGCVGAHQRSANWLLLPPQESAWTLPRQQTNPPFEGSIGLDPPQACRGRKSDCAGRGAGPVPCRSSKLSRLSGLPPGAIGDFLAPAATPARRVSRQGCVGRKGPIGPTPERRKYQRPWDGRVIVSIGDRSEHVSTAHDRTRSVAAHDGPRNQVTHGRSGASRITGSRAIISRRLATGPGRGALRGRIWFRTHHLDIPPGPDGLDRADPLGSADTHTAGGLASPPDAGDDTR